MFIIESNEAAVVAILNRAAARFDEMKPLYELIGEVLIRSTKKRFSDHEAPDGTKWRPRSPATLAKYGAKKSNSITADPMTFSEELLRSIARAAEQDQLLIGANRVYAAMMQAGGTKAQFPHLWGDIPARPYLGLSKQDISDTIAETEEWLGDGFGQP
jgi:phage virion morphogenesis protein